MRTKRRQRTFEERIALLRIVYISAMCLCLFMTILCLWGIQWLNCLKLHPDVLGLSAISVGIIGIISFYIFLYRYQIDGNLTRHQRWIVLLVHALVILLLFCVVIVLGFVLEFGIPDRWGNYNLQTASRSWIISILVVGAITMLGSFLELIGYSSPSMDQNQREKDESKDQS
jgi:hypothetical protein